MSSDGSRHRPLDQAVEQWSGAPLRGHLLALSLLVVITALRFSGDVFDPEPLPDERNYFWAFEAVANDEDLYPGSYLYPPALALLGGWMLPRTGPVALLAILRIANLVGLATAVWWALAWWPGPLRRRLALGTVFLCLAPAVRLGVRWGNLSLAAAGLVIVGLMVWQRRPVLAGVLLGLSVVVKPIAPAAILVLLAHRPAESGRRHLTAGLVALGLSGALLLLVPGFVAWLSVHAASGAPIRTLSLHRFAHLLGLPVHALALTVAVTLAFVLLSRWRPLEPLHLFALAVTTLLAATPLVWSHTLLVGLPLQTAALTVATGARDRLPRELLFVVLAVFAIQLAEGATGIYDYPVWLQLMGVLPPALAPAALTAYLYRRHPSRVTEGS